MPWPELPPGLVLQHCSHPGADSANILLCSIQPLQLDLVDNRFSVLGRPQAVSLYGSSDDRAPLQDLSYSCLKTLCSSHSVYHLLLSAKSLPRTSFSSSKCLSPAHALAGQAATPARPVCVLARRGRAVPGTQATGLGTRPVSPVISHSHKHPLKVKYGPPFV